MYNCNKRVMDLLRDASCSICKVSSVVHYVIIIPIIVNNHVLIWKLHKKVYQEKINISI